MKGLKWRLLPFFQNAMCCVMPVVFRCVFVCICRALCLIVFRPPHLFTRSAHLQLIHCGLFNIPFRSTRFPLRSAPLPNTLFRTASLFKRTLREWAICFQFSIYPFGVPFSWFKSATVQKKKKKHFFNRTEPSDFVLMSNARTVVDWNFCF